ncbi:MAG: hypothetical protein Q9M92_03965 [Enterobacterales bacterium]|nr:hypothetical protein [Enterobacterales bacterium]
MALYTFNHEANKYQLFIERTIPKNSVAFDFLTDPKGIDKLLLVESEKIFLIDFSSEKAEVSIKLSSIYLNPKPQFCS